MTPRASIIIPAYNEGEHVQRILLDVQEKVSVDYEAIVIVDTADDPTVAVVQRFGDSDKRFRAEVQTFGRGVANALRYGVTIAEAPVIVVTMADGSDDARAIDGLVHLVERGCVVAAASRYMPGGQQVGGPLVKSMLSRGAGLSLSMLARVGTRDATNSFKAYSADFLREVGVESDGGFEMGIELVAKARRMRRPVAELPTIWLDRIDGESKFDLMGTLPHYLRWYGLAFGRRLTQEQVKSRFARKGKKE